MYGKKFVQHRTTSSSSWLAVVGACVLICDSLVAFAQVTAPVQTEQTSSTKLPHTPGAQSAGGAIIYVDADAVGANNGTSWTNAYTDLQDALAGASGGGADIWVAEGTYTPAGPGGSRSATFSLINGVSIYGGFEGGETMLEQRTPSAYLTTLSGDLNGDDGPAPFEDDGENSLHVVTANSVDATAVLDGFTITAGNANGAVVDREGGGIYMSNGGASFRNCQIVYNRALAQGGGVYINNVGGPIPMFRSCSFVGNLAAGGGVTEGGGAIWFGGSGGDAEMRIIGCYFAYNSSSSYGGAIRVTGGGPISSRFLRAGNSFFYGNTADLEGGAIHSDPVTGTIVLSNCEFAINMANGGFSEGGGAIRHLSGLCLLSNCTLANNSATGQGGGINSSGGALDVENSILWGNSDSGGMTTNAQLTAGIASQLINCIVQGGWLGNGSSNLNSDPLFLDPLNDDYRVSSNSPAVDSGSNFSVIQDALDVDGDGDTAELIPLALGGIGRFQDNPYIADTGVGTAPIVDRGAYEMRAFNILYVDQDGLPGTGDWVNAYANLQDALTESRGSADTEIWVAAGTYYPDLGVGITPGDRSATFQLRDHVEIYGGFVGNETSLSQRDIESNVAVLSGDLLGDDLPAFDNRQENSYHVVTASGTDNTARLDGVVVRAGQAEGAGANTNYGAGVFNDGGDAVFSRVTIEDSLAANRGGGVYNVNDADPTFENCTIRNNCAGDGGGVAVVSAQSSPVLSNSMIYSNDSSVGGGVFVVLGSIYGEGLYLFDNTGEGGGCYFEAVSDTTIVDSAFQANSGGGGGGGAVFHRGPGSSTVNLNHCTFDSNQAGFSGLGGAVTSFAASTVVNNSTFHANTASAGGAIEVAASGSLTMANCFLLGNHALTSAAGGAIHIQGGGSTAEVTNCVFSGNEAVQALGSKGGAIAHAAGNLVITNCTFSGNTASADGGGVETSFGSLTVNNSVFRQNVDAGGMDESAQIHNGSGTQSVSYSLVQGGWTGTGSNNINADPLFVDADGPDNIVGTIDDDFRIRPGSPAIDAGDSSAVPPDSLDIDGDANTSERTPFDLAGLARFYDDPPTTDTGVPAVFYPVVDMGAFEFGGEDCNNNGLPDNCDLSCGPANGPCDVPGCGQSVDLDSNGLPDECVGFITGCAGGAGDDWSCFDNWVLPGDVYPDNLGPDTYDVELDATDTVFLDVDVTIDSLTLLDSSVLSVTQSGSAGDLFIATEAGLTNEGTILISNGRTIDLLCGQVTVRDGNYIPGPGTVSGALECETLTILPGGVMTLDGTMSVDASISVTLDGTNAATCFEDGGKTPPVLNVKSFASVDIAGNFNLIGNISFTNNSSTFMNVGGDFDNGSTSPDCFDCSLGGLNMVGSSPQGFEVAGEDFGASTNGFAHPDGHTNYSMRTLHVHDNGPNNVVTFRNARNNQVGIGACSEALYVHTLWLHANSSIVLDNVRVYYQFLNDEGATINTIGCGQLLSATQACTSQSQCNDDLACTFDACTLGFCSHVYVEFGNTNGAGPIQPTLDDILCVLGGFASAANCPNGDLVPCNSGPGTINLDDILAVLGAFGGADPCGCVP